MFHRERNQYRGPVHPLICSCVDCVDLRARGLNPNRHRSEAIKEAHTSVVPGAFEVLYASQDSNVADQSSNQETVTTMGIGYSRRGRGRRVAVHVGLLIAGGIITLGLLPYLPGPWVSWVGDRQASLTRYVNWGSQPQRQVVLSDSQIQAYLQPDLYSAVAGDRVNYSGRDWIVSRRWTGATSTEIDWQPAASPWLLAWTSKPTSTLSSSLTISYVDSSLLNTADQSEIAEMFVSGRISSSRTGDALIGDSGRGRIIVEASGLEWTLFTLRELPLETE